MIAVRVVSPGSRTLAVVLIGTIVAALSAAQQAPAPAQQATFRSGVDYVRVDVVVTDSNDRPIVDLTKDDFEIVERGRAQAIDDFQFVSVPVATPTKGPAAPIGPTPDVVTNTAPTPDSRLFAMIVDDLHIVESDIIDTKRVMTEFIRALAPDDEVAIVFPMHSTLGENFTRDRATLLRAVERVREALGFALDAYGASTTSQVVAPDARIIGRYAREADYVLKNVAMSLAGSGHSRRAIVYVTAGSVAPTSPMGIGTGPSDFDYLQEAYEAARRANVPIYTIDPRGLALPEDVVRGGIGSIGGIDTSSETPRPNFSASKRAQIAANIRAQNSRLAEIAINTGGRAFTQQSDLTRAIREIVAENGSYYLLGYYPTPFTADGKFHTFDVKVKRPGARVRARAGYVASAAEPATGDPKPALDAAMSSGVNVSALPLRAVAAPLARGPKGVNTAVTIEVTYPTRPPGSRALDDELQVRIVALDPDAKIKATSGRTVAFKGTSGDQRAATVLINDVIELPSQPLTLRIGVVSRVLGKAGSVQMPVDVPKLSESRLVFGGVAIAAAGASAVALNGDALTPIVPFQPTTTRAFGATETLRVFGRAFWKSKDAAVISVAIKSIAGSTVKPVLAVSPGANGGQEATVDATLPLAGLSPGAYVITITGQLGREKAVIRDVPITVR